MKYRQIQPIIDKLAEAVAKREAEATA